MAGHGTRCRNRRCDPRRVPRDTGRRPRAAQGLRFRRPGEGDSPSVVAYEAERRVRLPALRAGWLTQTFVHWSFPPETVQALVPEQLVVDEYEDAAWVGLTSFVMADVRLPGVPAAVPGLPAFAETNLRTYVRHPDGRDGPWFLSLEVTCPLMPAARGIGAPYHPGLLEVSGKGGTVSYFRQEMDGRGRLPAGRPPRRPDRAADGAARVADLAPAGLHPPARRALGDAGGARTVAAGRRHRGAAGGDADRLRRAAGSFWRACGALLGRSQACAAGSLAALCADGRFCLRPGPRRGTAAGGLWG